MQTTFRLFTVRDETKHPKELGCFAYFRHFDNALTYAKEELPDGWRLTCKDPFIELHKPTDSDVICHIPKLEPWDSVRAGLIMEQNNRARLRRNARERRARIASERTVWVHKLG